MLAVIINWIFIFITSYAIGYMLLRMYGRLLKIDVIDIKNANIIRVFLGLAAVTAYAEIWSIFGEVGTWACYILMILSMCAWYGSRNDMGKALQSTSRVKSLVYCGLIVLMAYGTSRGYMHFDTNLYHAQAIRWIEEYGVVPGLANLQSRFGYNSSEFALNALYSLWWCMGQSLHATAGFFALLSSMIMVDISHIWSEKNSEGKREINIWISDYVRLGLLFYLGLIYSEMISPASDYYAQLLIFDIVILWIDALNKYSAEEKDKLRAYQGLLCIILAYAITIKLSIGLLVLLAFVPGIYWIRQKNAKSIITCFLSGLVVAAPYFIRNYIISGWILYPSTLIEIGSPDWQLPKGEAQYDAREIGMWGRGVTRAEDWDSVTATNWIGNWFGNLATIEKVWVLGSAIAVVAIITLLVIELVYSVKNKKHRFNMEYLSLMAVLSVGTIFWFISAPLVRYGYAYLLIMPLIVMGYLATNYLSKEIGRYKVATIIYLVLAIGMVGLKAKGLASDILRTKDMPYYKVQQDYIDGEATSYEIDGVTIYVADDAGQIGYYKFPASVDEKRDIELRGNDLSSGFQQTK